MSNNLVIVESPAKAKTIEKYLGKDYKVSSCYGHIRDLAKDDKSIDKEKGFIPTYVPSPEKKKVIKELKSLRIKSKKVFLATDNDREGEAIAWHLKELLNLKEDEYLTTFQSRFGPDEWLTPYTDKTLKELPSQGIKKIHILSPGFSSDCLETLEELKVENKSNFISAGGEKYNYINCLNDNSDHLKMLSSVILNNLKGW